MSPKTGPDTRSVSGTALEVKRARKRRSTSEQIDTKLREAEVLVSQGRTIAQAGKTLEISEQTYFRWRKEYGGMDTRQAKRRKHLEKENLELKKEVADLSLDNAIIKEALRNN